MRPATWFAGLPVLALMACAPVMGVPDLESIYGQASQIQGPERLPLISVPGILGSRLVLEETGEAIWGGRLQLSADPRDPEGLRALALPIGDGSAPNRSLHDGVRPSGVLLAAYPSIFGLPVEVSVYRKVLDTVRLGGWKIYVDPDREPGPNRSNAPPIPPEEANAFPFAYDWRRDMIDIVREFDRFVRAKTEQIALRSARIPGDTEPIRFNLISHSMGTLIVRYYLMYGTQDLPEDGSLPKLTWEGARHFNRVVLVAPPNAGSVSALDNLVNGKALGPLQPVYPPALVGTYFSVYALMPRNRHHHVRWADTGEPVEDIYDPALWQKLGWGLASPEAEADLATLMPDEPDPARRRARALAFLAEALTRARQFHAALDREVDALPDDLRIHMVVGGSFRTPAGARVDRATGKLEIDSFAEGDGVVLRSSSLLDEREGGTYTLGLRSPLKFTSVLFLPEEHVALTQSPVFGDNMLFWLLEGRRPAPALRRTAAEPEKVRQDKGGILGGDR